MEIAINIQKLLLLALLLAACTPSSPLETSISGRVVDARGPVEGALVRVKAAEISTRTDAAGDFTLVGLPRGERAAITAWAPGYYIAGGEELAPGSSAVEMELLELPGTDNAGYRWLSAFASEGEEANCQNCHSQPAGDLPFDQWRLDAHSRTAANERFLSMYAGTDIAGNQSPVTRFAYSWEYGSFPLRPDRSQAYFGPGYKLDFPDTDGNCAACHLPAAAANQPYTVDPRHVVGPEAEGIACDFCHKVWAVRLDPLTGLPDAGKPGVLSFELRRPPAGHQFFAGPLDDVAPGEDTYSPLQQQGQYCAPCHFGVFWNTSIYNSFGEWLDSPYGDPGSDSFTPCQVCHMPPSGADHFARLDRGGVSRAPGTIFSHRMPGASDPELLQNAVTLRVQAARNGDLLVVEVALINDKTGHHVPTDSPLRQMLLLLAAQDAGGRPLTLLSGPVLPDWTGIGDPQNGDFAGQPGVAFAKVLQELWTEVSPTGAYWNPTRILSDTRVPAFGSHTSRYSFALPASGEWRLQATLLFRRAFIELMEQKGWNVPDIIMEEISITGG